MSAAGRPAILKELEDDEKHGVWQWFGVTSELRLEDPKQVDRELTSSLADAMQLAQ